MYFKIFIIFSGAVCTHEQTSHVLKRTRGCFDSGDTLLSVTFDDDEIYYADYKKGQVEWAARLPSDTHNPDAYLDMLGEKYWCQSWRELLEHDKSVTKQVNDAPETVIYSKDEAVMGEENTLICFVNHFFPPSIKVKWTKNDKEITVEDRVLSYLINSDLTYRHISTLTFTPQEGDVYACTVEHEALQEPQTRFWDPDITESSSAPAVFCGVGLTLGLLGITSGTFLLVKAKYLN